MSLAFLLLRSTLASQASAAVAMLKAALLTMAMR